MRDLLKAVRRIPNIYRLAECDDHSIIHSSLLVEAHDIANAIRGPDTGIEFPATVAVRVCGGRGKFKCVTRQPASM